MADGLSSQFPLDNPYRLLRTSCQLSSIAAVDRKFKLSKPALVSAEVVEQRLPVRAAVDRRFGIGHILVNLPAVSVSQTSSAIERDRAADNRRAVARTSPAGARTAQPRRGLRGRRP